MFKSKNIVLYSTYNETKAVLVERFIRTLRKKIERMFIIMHSTNWINLLQTIIDEYNNEKHHHLHGLTPTQARLPSNKSFVYKCQFDKKFTEKDREPKFQVGSKVRISQLKRTFEKEATASWSEEIFTIRSLIFKERVLYELEDLLGEPLHGGFYAEQLQPTNSSIYRVERILRKRTHSGVPQVLVKWYGYDKKFNSWEPSENIKKSR